MRCEEFEDRLNAVLDQRRRAEWDPELAAHFQVCDACQQLAAAYDDLLDGFHALAGPTAPADLTARVMDQMRPQPVLARRWPLVAAALATAAGLLIATLPLREAPTQQNRAAAVANPKLRVMVERSSFSDIASLAALKSDDPYRDLARGTGQGLATVVLATPNVPGGIATAAVWNVATYDPVWSTQVGGGLKPVAESMSETFAVLRQVMPLGQLADRSK